MPRPRIGIGARTQHPDRLPAFIGLRSGYIDAVVAAGGVPLLLPPLALIEPLRAAYDAVDGLILGGGEDVDPMFYGELPHPAAGAPDRQRDAAEIALARWAFAEGKPLFAICRGQQILDVALGGSLWQHLPDDCPSDIEHRPSTAEPGLDAWREHRHRLVLDPESLLADLLGTTEVQVNSLHHQAIQRVADGLIVTGRSPDGVIEAIEGAGPGLVIGLQCHPEELWQDDTAWLAPFQALVEAATGWRLAAG